VFTLSHRNSFYLGRDTTGGPNCDHPKQQQRAPQPPKKDFDPLLTRVNPIFQLPTHPPVGLYKIWFTSKGLRAGVKASFYCPPPPAMAALCHAIARLLRNVRPPPPPPFCMPYSMHHWQWQYRVRATPPCPGRDTAGEGGGDGPEQQQQQRAPQPPKKGPRSASNHIATDSHFSSLYPGRDTAGGPNDERPEEQQTAYPATP